MVIFPEPGRVQLSALQKEPTPVITGSAPSDTMRNMLHGTRQMPYRLTTATGIIEEMEKRLTRGVLNFDIMGMINYQDSSYSVSPTGTSPSGKRIAFMEPGFVCSPGRQRIPLVHKNLGPNPSTRKFRSMAVECFQPLTDNEMTERPFGFVPLQAGDVILWRRDIPFTHCSGVKDDEADGMFSYASQYVSWAPAEARSEMEQLAMQNLFKKHRRRYKQIYQIQAPPLPRSRKRKRTRDVQLCKNACSISIQHYNVL